MPPKDKNDAVWIEEVVAEAVRRTRVAGLIAALQEAQKKDATTGGGGGYASGAPEAKAMAEPEKVGKICKSCGLDLPKDQFSKKQWTLGAERRCIPCVSKGGSENTNWTTVEKEPKKKDRTKSEEMAEAKDAAPAKEEPGEDEDDGFEEVSNKKMSKKKLKDNPGFVNKKAA